MIKKNLIAIIVTCICNISCSAQKTYYLNGFQKTLYELNELQKIPSVDQANMDKLAEAAYRVFQQIKLSPEKYATNAIRNTANCVYLYYDVNGDGNLKKINPRKGQKYTDDYRDSVMQNDRLLFNLSFDETGKVIAPDKFYVISYQEIELHRNISDAGLVAFEVPTNDSVKNELAKIRLSGLAIAAAVPVSVIIPFNLQCKSFTDYNPTEGIGTKRGKSIEIRKLDGFAWYEKEEAVIIEKIKTQSDIMQYRKADFKFSIPYDGFSCNLDINIGRDIVYSSRPIGNYQLSTESVKIDVTDGKK